METIQTIRVKETNKVILQPYHLQNLNTAIQKAVLNLIFTYRNYENTPSIIIAVSKIQILSDEIETFDDFPQLIVEIQYTLTLLQFKLGAIVRGVIVQQQQSHIIVQLFGLFNIVIQEEEIPDKVYQWNYEFNSFINNKTNEVLSQGQEMQIQILEFNGNSIDPKMFDIKGSLKDRKMTGLIHLVSQEIETDDKISKIIEKSSQMI